MKQWILLFALATLAARVSGAETIITADSFSRAVAEAKPGSALLLADGLYRDVNWLFKAAGEEGKPIELRAQHPGKAVLTGSSQLIITGGHLVVSGLVFDQAWGPKVVEFSGARQCRLTDCAFIECGNPASTFAHVVYMVNTSQHNRVDHCLAQGSLSMSMGVSVHEDDFANTFNTFDHNYIRDIVRRSSNGQEGVQVGQNKFSSRQSVHALVEYCLFERASGDAEIISNKSCDNTYRFNTFRDCSQAMLTLRSGGSALVQGNVFLNCQSGVRIHAANSAIVGNVIEGCEDGILLNKGNGPEVDASPYVAANHCLIANNVIRNCKKSAIRIGGNSQSSATVAPSANLFVNNILGGARGELIDFDAPNESTWQAVSLVPEGAAKPGVRPKGVKVEPAELEEASEIKVMPASRAARIRDFSKEIEPLLAGMMTPRKFEEVFPENMELKIMRPAEVGPSWMKGRPETLPRIPDPQAIPPMPKKKK